MFPGYQLLSITSVVTIFPSFQSLTINQYFVYSMSVVCQCWLFRCHPSSGGMWSSTSLSNYVFLILMSLIASNKMFGDVFGWFDRDFSSGIAIPMHKVLNVITFAQVTHNAIDCVLARPLLISSVVLSLPVSSTLSCCSSTGSFGMYTSCGSSYWADDTNVAWSIKTVIQIPSSSTVIFVVDISAVKNGSVSRDISLLYDSVARRFAAGLVIGGMSR